MRKRSIKSDESKDDLGIPDEVLESLARTLLPAIREYLSSEEGKKDFAEWQAQRQQKRN